MSDHFGKSARTIWVADHLWEALEKMAHEMGADRDGLINQALFTFARLNGYVAAGRTGALLQVASGFSGANLEPAVTSLPRAASMGAMTAPPVASAPPASPNALDEDAVRARAELESALAGSDDDYGEGRAGDDFQPQADDAGLSDSGESEDSEADAGDARAAAAAEAGDESEAEKESELAEDEGLDDANLPSDVKRVDTAPARGPRRNGQLLPTLMISVKDQPAIPMTSDRFLIGRGKHCDLVIDSNRVSREHALVSRSGPDVFIEDLQSSNGTWFNKVRIQKRKIEDGDEYVLGTERIRFGLQEA
jgi:hypothetical protein